MAEGINRQSLEREDIQAHWLELSSALSRLLQWMDSREGWAVEPGGEQLDLLTVIVSHVENPSFVREIEQGEGSAAIAEVFATLNSSRFVRVLELMDKCKPGIASRLTLALGRLGGNAEVFADLFFERLMVVHKCGLMGQIFSTDRCQKIAASVSMIQESRR